MSDFTLRVSFPNVGQAVHEAFRIRAHPVAAQVVGFTIEKSEVRCMICLAQGHYSFECPEAPFNQFKANVMCTICGDKGHVAMDCPQKIAEFKVAIIPSQESSVSWKATGTECIETVQKSHTVNIPRFHADG